MLGSTPGRLTNFGQGCYKQRNAVDYNHEGGDFNLSNEMSKELKDWLWTHNSADRKRNK